ncbi:GTP 3',8-cyclase MoaA [uncultured Neptuniibacter sp.]|uniref:GTP 3',8-cyclase MoaA n=1 Tax=uncultured Neptuniibacter sp. TaxID=502143 RepID=UPI00261272D9|nr:GTP 3',8-cyclase MoaA [uncultured Neptuniibacter sp.]
MTDAADQLIDGYGRKLDYIRLSVTDRCDFRCVYCMAEEMTFLPRARVLSLEELATLGETFVNLGIRRIRLTGGEPLVRRDIVSLISKLAALPGLDEVTLTTNGSQLGRYAQALKKAGLKRINVSLDSLRADRFAQMTRRDMLDQVLLGIDKAVEVGFERIKLNAVVMRGHNDDEVLDLIHYAQQRNIDISFIEEMPLGQISSHNRQQAYCSSEDLRQIIENKYPLISSTDTTGGPSRYYRIPGKPGRIGFISPHSHNFCASCNRLRVTAEGRLLLCLGQENSIDLRAILRRYPGESDRLESSIREAIKHRPEGHQFSFDDQPQVLRFMNMTGG